MTLLSARALTVRIGETHVCEGLDFDLEPGQRWALLGGNGAGKTTLLHTLAGLRAPVAGSIHAAGIDLRIWNRKSLARRLGMLFQDSRDTMPGTVLETALTGRYPHLPLWAIEGEEDFRIAESALRDVELWTMRSRRVDTLSGGERRRLAIAVLLVQSPQIWLLDEPTNHLDLRHQVGLLHMVGERVRAAGGGLVMSLHDVNLALRACTHAALIVGGGELLCGPVSDVVRAEQLERMYRCSVRQVAGADGETFYFPA
ncbi:MAG TPA: ABC transporter ATP-binding protein [Gammaproteobacteria bacterium]